MPLQVLTIVGARPQFIKAAVMSRALRRFGVTEIMVHTGQHFDWRMSDIFFDELGISRPAHQLEINSGGHGGMTGRMLQALEPVMMDKRPDVVLVFGDTNSTLAGALCAAKLHIPVVHVEAGLRSFDRRMPEEINRVVVDHLSELLLCPTRAAVAHLTAEGIHQGVHHVGDVMQDAVLYAAKEANVRSRVLEMLSIEPRQYAVATVHRPENTDDPERLGCVVRWLMQQARTTPVILPLHPRMRKVWQCEDLDLGDVRLIEPLGYFDMTCLVRHASAVFTDSGGLQKEAYFHRVPCVTLRSVTEWVETVEAGWNRLWTQSDYQMPRREIDEYGQGSAGLLIADLIVHHFEGKRP